MAAWERAARLAPDRPEAWYGHGDELFHRGPVVMGPDSADAAAEAAFDRAMDLDSSYAAPLLHLIQLAIWRGDTAEARRRAVLFLALDSTGDDADFVRWRTALALGDSAGAAVIERRLDSVPHRSLDLIATWGQLDGVHVGIAVRAAEALRRHAVNAGERFYADRLVADVYGNAGRFRERYGLLDRIVAERHAWSLLLQGTYVNDALCWDGDTARAARLVPLYERLAATGGGDTAAYAALRAFLWHVRRDHAPDWPQLARWNHRFLEGSDRSFAPLTAALTAAGRRAAGAPAQVRTLDSVTALTDLSERAFMTCGSLWAHEAVGDVAGAASAARRGERNDLPGLRYLAGLRRMTGRLAALSGDTAAAIRAYRHYLALREDADPEIRPQVEAVRTELARLEHAAARR